MNILKQVQLESNKNIKIDFDGGDLSSDSGLLLIKEFAYKLGLPELISSCVKTEGDDSRTHKDAQNVLQIIFQTYAGYFSSNDADELTNEPIFKSILEKNSLASQPTLSRFFNRLDHENLEQFNQITKEIRRIAYKIKSPESVLFDLDSTLFHTYGTQEGNKFNYHYSANGYHPLLCYDGLTGDLIKGEIRDGSAYCCNGVTEFMQPIFDEYLDEHPDIQLFLRGDSGFASPKLFKQCETNGTYYAIRLKSNAKLDSLARCAVEQIEERMAENIIDYAVVYDEFYYQAGTWEYPRRVVVKVEKPSGRLDYQCGFIVTNMSLAPRQVLKYYCNRGKMENFIKECKNGFNFESTSSKHKVTNENRFEIQMLAYSIFNYFRRLVLPAKMRKMQICTIRTKLIKIASKVVSGGRYKRFKLCSSCPYKSEFYNTISNIHKLPLLE